MEITSCESPCFTGKMVLKVSTDLTNDLLNDGSHALVSLGDALNPTPSIHFEP